MTIIAIMLVCAVTAFWILKPTARIKSARRVPANAKAPAKQHNLYQAASINYGGCACTAVKALGEKRFLANRAPQVPLADCDSGKCQCRYIRHADRRAGEDRRDQYGLQTDLHVVAGKEEHRVKSNRRRNDGFTSVASGLDYKDFKWATSYPGA